MRSDIYGTEIDKGLETIVESMHTYVDTDTVEETGCNTKREDTEDVDDLQALHDNLMKSSLKRTMAVYKHIKICSKRKSRNFRR